MKLNVIIEQDEIKRVQIQRAKYSLIISAWVLNFSRQDEISDIISKIKNGVKKNGFIYVSVFPTTNPSFKDAKKTQKMVEKNTFYSERSNTYFHFFEKRELLSSFRDLKLIYCIEGIELDINHAKPHYHGIIIYLGQKTNT